MAGGRHYLDELALGNLPTQLVLDSTSLSVGNLVFVDAVNGDDAAGIVGQIGSPFLTISAAILAASAGDVVLVLAGTYVEVLTMKTGVSVIGISQDSCILSITSAVAATLVTMADSMVFANFSLVLTSSPGVITGILFAGTTNATSTARNIKIDSSGTSTLPVSLTGTGVVTSEHFTLDRVIAVAVGITNALVASGIGTSRIRDSRFFGFIGATFSAGTAQVFGSYFEGIAGLNIGVGATVAVDYGTTWNSAFGLDRLGVGTLTVLGSAAPIPSATDQDTATTGIDNVTPTILMTLPATRAELQRVIVHVSLQLENTAGARRDVSFRLFRDGAEVDITDRYSISLEATDDGVTRSFHFVDDAPTNRPVYTVRALGSNTGVNRIANSRATAIVTQP